MDGKNEGLQGEVTSRPKYLHQWSVVGGREFSSVNSQQVQPRTTKQGLDTQDERERGDRALSIGAAPCPCPQFISGLTDWLLVYLTVSISARHF